MKKPTQEELRDFVSREVYINQTMLVNELLEKDIFNYPADIYNLTKTDKQLKDEGYEDIEEARNNGEDMQEIFEWWICSDWLIERLEEKGEPILKTDNGDWWGRTCTGQAILLDSVIEEIYTGMKK